MSKDHPPVLPVPPHDPPLKEADVEAVVQVVEAWAGPVLSWPLLVEAAAAQTGMRHAIRRLQGADAYASLM